MLACYYNNNSNYNHPIFGLFHSKNIISNYEWKWKINFNLISSYMLWISNEIKIKLNHK